MKILIPTSGVGSRLGNLTKHTNKTLIKIGDQATISHIIDQYPEEEFVITLGYYGDHVKQFLEIAYPNRKFEFVQVDPYEGKGSGLLKSISFARDYLQCPFVFHVCDTIIKGDLPFPLSNWMACGSPSEHADIYRTVNTSKGKIVKINEKGEMNYDYTYLGVAGIYDYEKFWKELDKVIDTPDSSDCHVFEKMLPEVEFKRWGIDKWYDIGNVDGLSKARKAFKSNYRVLDKHEEAIYFTEHSVIKFFNESKICQNRVTRAQLLVGLVPPLIDSTKNFYKYKLMEGELLSEVITEGKLKSLIEWAENNLWKRVNRDRIEFRETLKRFYYDKTLQRVKNYLEISGEQDKECVINSIEVPSCKEILEHLDWESLYDAAPKRIHGDFVMENILYNKGDFTLLDWRQDIGGDMEAGSIYYDLSKLNHNFIINHEIISNNCYTINTGNNGVICDVHRSHNLVLYQQFYLNLLRDKGYDLNRVRTLSALIWLNMAPLHTYPLNKFLFYFGKYNLCREVFLT